MHYLVEMNGAGSLCVLAWLGSQARVCLPSKLLSLSSEQTV